MHRYLLMTILALFGSQLLSAQDVSVSLDQAECLPIGENGLVTATVENAPGGSSVRIYFRRLHEEVEDFYYVIARPSGGGRHWAVLPEAEDEELEERDLDGDFDDDDNPEEGWAEWWRTKVTVDDRDPNDDLDQELIEERAAQGRSEPREWLEALDDATLQEWLEGLENEPAEYFGTVYDDTGKRIARSDMKVVEVRDDCEVELTEQQEGESENLTIGETAEWERGERVFHWLCDGIVSRINPLDILRADDHCRACVIAWWQKKEILIPALLVPPAIVISNRDDPPVSPSAP